MFIVLESIDGGGKGKQREILGQIYKAKLKDNFKEEGFPVHNSFYENVIHPALQEETHMNKSSWVLSYLLDKTLYTDNITPFLKSETNLFLADGYFTTTIAYQGMLMNQVSVEKLIEYSKDFEIPKPDLAIYLDVDPEIAMKRKQIEPGHDEGLDMFEKSIEKQKNLRGIFKKMVNNKIYCPWVEINGNNSIEEVTNEILEVLKVRTRIE